MAKPALPPASSDLGALLAVPTQVELCERAVQAI